jgi:hypothetical protein
MRLLVVGVLTPLLLLAPLCAAQERHRPSTRAARLAQRAAATAAARPAEDAPVPVLPQDPSWARPLLVALGVMALAAAVIGPIYRAWVPEEIPPTHSHDEPPGASHRHGPGGERES